MTAPASGQALRERVGQVIFGYESRSGRLFDVVLLFVILASVIAVMLETVPSIRDGYGTFLYRLEWVFTMIFTAEYALRLWVARHRWRYARSFFGVVDLLSVLPTYLSLFVTGTQSLLVIRALRLLRVFRILKLSRYLDEGNVLITALRSSGYKIIIFLGTVLVAITIVATLMFMIEGPEHGFSSIPRSFYWAIVTITTVGYGDIAPQTTLGRILAGGVMLIGYAIIAVPTGIVSAEVAHTAARLRRRTCPSCGADEHEPDARFCRVCSAELSGTPGA